MKRLDAQDAIAGESEIETMTCYQVVKPGVLELGRSCIPRQLRSGQVRLSVLAVGICRTDVSHFLGVTTACAPWIPGHEVVGEVVQCHPSLTGSVERGQRLVYFGGTDFGGLAQSRLIRPLFVGQDATEVIVDERGFVDADHAAAAIWPVGRDPVEGVLAEPLCAVLRSLGNCPPVPGDRVLILGGGVAGQLALRVLKACFSPQSVEVLDTSPMRRALALKSGANAAWHPADHELTQRATDAKGDLIDYVFDALPGTLDPEGARVRWVAASLLRPAGRINLFAAAELPTEPLPFMQILAKGQHLIGGAAFDERAFAMRRTAAALDHAVRLITNGTIRVADLVTHVVPFDDEDGVRAAFVRHAKGERLKTVITL